MMPKRVSNNYIVKPALPDNNCVVNSFAIVLQDTLHEIEQYHIEAGLNINQNLAFFLERVSKVYHVGRNFYAVKNAIQDDNNNTHLQKTLAPILREVVVHFIDTNSGQNVLVSQLTSSFHQYLNNTYTNTTDDIFSAIPDFKVKFAEIKGSKTGDKLKALLDWWESDGFEKFKSHIATPGNWLGDFELAILCEYFKVNLNLIKNNNIYSIISNNGELSANFVNENRQTVKELVKRNVVARDDYRFTFSKKVILEDKLSALEEFQPNKSLMEYNHATIQRMLDRRILKNAEGKLIYKKHARRRAQPIKRKNEILDFFHKRPKITLQHTGDHYNAAIKKSKAMQVLARQEKRAATRKIFATLTQSILDFFAKGPVYNEKQHVGLIEYAKAATSPIESPILYTAGNQTFFVNRDNQIKLDEQLATKLQQQEYLLYRSKK